MPTFAYQAVDANRRTVRGRTVAETREQAEGHLREQGLYVLTINESRGASIADRMANLRKVPLRELVVFSRQFSTMINAGMNLMKCLDILKGQTSNARLKEVIQQARDDVASGSSLTDALRKHPAVFSDLYINMVKAAEAGGILDIVLNRLAGYLEYEMEIKGQVKSAMVYPVVVLVFAVGMMMVLTFFILPKFKEVFESIGADLPIYTKVLMNSSTYAAKYFYVPIVAIVAFVLLYRAYVKMPKGRYQVDSLKLRLPIAGTIAKKMAISRFARTFATLVRSGVPTPQALEIVASTAGNAVISSSVERAQQAVMQGDKLSTPLIEDGVFPDMVTQMIAVGEETGHIDEMLEKISDFYDREVEQALEALPKLIEPIMIVGLGVLVGFVAISVIMPIYNLVGQASSGKL